MQYSTLAYSKRVARFIAQDMLIERHWLVEETIHGFLASVASSSSEFFFRMDVGTWVRSLVCRHRGLARLASSAAPRSRGLMRLDRAAVANLYRSTQPQGSPAFPNIATHRFRTLFNKSGVKDCSGQCIVQLQSPSLKLNHRGRKYFRSGRFSTHERTDQVVFVAAVTMFLQQHVPLWGTELFCLRKYLLSSDGHCVRHTAMIGSY